MPSRRIISQNKHYGFKNKPSSQTEHLNFDTKSFDELKQELIIINDRKRIFNLTWHQILAVLVFVFGVFIIVALRA